MRGHRWWALAAVAAVPLLTGCDVDARAAVAPDDTMTVDLTVWTRVSDQVAVNGQAYCQLGSGHGGLACETLADPADPRHVGVRLHGQTAISWLADAWSVPAFIIHKGGHYEVLMQPEVLGWAGRDLTSNDITAETGSFHAEVTFPGPVTAHDLSARVLGQSVVWDDRTAKDLGGAWASSLEEGQLTTATWAQVAALGGAAVGAAVMSAAWLLRGSRRHLGGPLELEASGDLSVQDRAPAASSADETSFARPAVDACEDTSVWAPGSGDSRPG